MKRLLLVMLLTLILLVPSLVAQSDEDKEIAAAQDYTNAILKKTAQEKITAFKAYIRKYPDTSQKFTKLAYYMLTVNYFHAKNYVQTAQIGEKTMKMGDLPNRGEQARLYLVVGNAYGIKSAPIYNKSKALQYTNRAITLARGQDGEVLKAAQDLKSKLTGPPPKTQTPEQKIKMLVYQNENYRGAISYYRSLAAGDKGNAVIHETYATALLKANQLDSALREFTALQQKSAKGNNAKNMAEIYAKKAKRNRSLYDKAVDMYIDAAILFRKEGSTSKYNAALKLGKYQLFEKYNFNTKINRYNASQKKNQSSAAKMKSEIAKLEKELRLHRRHLRKTYEYNDLDPPQYETDKENNLEKKIARLKSGGSAADDAEGAKLMEEKKRIEKEFNDRVAAKR